MSTATTARAFLGMNAGFSVLTGATLLIQPDTVSRMMFADLAAWQPVVMRALGFGLLIFAAAMIMMAKNRRVTRIEIMLIVFADIGWIICSALLLALAGPLFTANGTLIVEGIAALVGIFAVGQFAGARRIARPLSP